MVVGELSREGLQRRGKGGQRKGAIICQRARTPKCAKSRRSAARAAHCFLVCQVFRAPRPSGGRAIVAREVVQPLSLDKAGDPNALLLCIVRGRNQGTGWRTHARPRDMPYRLRGLSTSMTMTTPPSTRRLFVTLLLSNVKNILAEGSRKNKKRILGNYEI